MSLKNRRALVTGASRGIGQAIADAFATEHMRLFLTSRDQRALERVKSDLTAKGENVDCAAADLADVAETERMFNKAIEFLGGIDVLVNNAGVGIKKTVTETSMSEWEEMFKVNLRAVFVLSKLAARKMIAQGSGHIINIGSGASQTPIAEFAGYCATKHGLLGFSESLALELREHGVKVSIVLPGSTATHFGGSNPAGKLAGKPGLLLPQDIADATLYLLRQNRRAWTSVLNVRPLNLNKG